MMHLDIYVSMQANYDDLARVVSSVFILDMYLRSCFLWCCKVSFTSAMKHTADHFNP